MTKPITFSQAEMRSRSPISRFSSERIVRAVRRAASCASSGETSDGTFPIAWYGVPSGFRADVPETNAVFPRTSTGTGGPSTEGL